MSKSPFLECVSRLAGQEFATVYGTLKFVSLFTTPRHPEPHECSPHFGTVNYDTFSSPFHVKIILRDQFPSDFPTNTPLAYKCLTHCKHSSCSSHLVLLEFRLFYSIDKTHGYQTLVVGTWSDIGTQFLTLWTVLWFISERCFFFVGAFA